MMGKEISQLQLSLTLKVWKVSIIHRRRGERQQIAEHSVIAATHLE